MAVLKIIEKLMGLRVTAEEEEQGLDMTQHGEQAYAGLVWYVPSVVPSKEGEEQEGPKQQEMRYTYQKKGPPRR